MDRLLCHESLREGPVLPGDEIPAPANRPSSQGATGSSESGHQAPERSTGLEEFAFDLEAHPSQNEHNQPRPAPGEPGRTAIVEHLRSNREHVLAMVRQDGLALKDARWPFAAVDYGMPAPARAHRQMRSDGLRADREVALAAVDQNLARCMHAVRVPHEAGMLHTARTSHLARRAHVCCLVHACCGVTACCLSHGILCDAPEYLDERLRTFLFGYGTRAVV